MRFTKIYLILFNNFFKSLNLFETLNYFSFIYCFEWLFACLILCNWRGCTRVANTFSKFKDLRIHSSSELPLASMLLQGLILRCTSIINANQLFQSTQKKHSDQNLTFSKIMTKNKEHQNETKNQKKYLQQCSPIQNHFSF